MGEGLPLIDAMKLFGGKPYEEPVLLNSTRATLCWLTALNVIVREHVISKFPEMLMFEGDPTAWTEPEVVEAFQGYIDRLDAGFRPDWWNDLGELRRVARCIPAWQLGQLLRSYPDSDRVTPKLLAIVHHGRKDECADDVFAIYRGRATSFRSALYALHALRTIATEQQRMAVKADLLSARLSGNEYIAAAIEVAGMARLTTAELSTIFSACNEEQDYGGGPMARMVKDLAEDCRFDDVMILIEALLNALPHRRGRRARAEEVGAKDRWKLHVLPVCVTRAVDQLGGTGVDAPASLFDAALYLEEIHHTSHVTKEQFASLVKAVEAKKDYRSALILAIARNGDLQAMPSRVFFGANCQLTVTADTDLVQAVERAVAPAVDQATRDIWFRLAEWLSYRTPEKQRARTLQQLLSVVGPERDTRTKYLAEQAKLAVEGRRQQAKWRARDARDAQVTARSLKKNKQTLLRCIKELRSGQHFGAIQFLVGVAEERGARARYTHVDAGLVQRDFGRSIASAFDKGLAKFWKRNQAPDVLTYEKSQVPWVGLLGLASLNHSVKRGLHLRALTDHEVEQAVRFCVWELEEPPEWYQELARTRTDVAVRALRPWVQQELEMRESEATFARTMELVFRSPPELRLPLLREGVAAGMRGKIPKHRLCRQVFDQAVECGLVDSVTANRWVQSMLSMSHGAVPVEDKQSWLSRWFEIDFDAAWKWVTSHRRALRAETAAVALCVGRAMSSRSNQQGRSAAVQAPIATLHSIYSFLSPYIAMKLDAKSNQDRHWHPVEQARDWIPAALAATEGTAAHAALLGLKSAASSEVEAHWLQTFILAHAVADAQRCSKRQPSELMNLGDPYCHDPKTASELCQQVLARLAQIRANVEYGPFSDRILFSPGMPEKHLQLWLAARLNDTPIRKFSARYVVHREPEVDDDKRTDVEVSARNFKVCIELKPVDKSRYGAADLRDTLDRQLVRQYLKGGSNSRHGVLVVLCLEDKSWHIPGVGRKATFDHLIAHLSDHAHALRAEHPLIESLCVVGIDCRPRPRPRTSASARIV